MFMDEDMFPDYQNDKLYLLLQLFQSLRFMIPIISIYFLLNVKKLSLIGVSLRHILVIGLNQMNLVRKWIRIWFVFPLQTTILPFLPKLCTCFHYASYVHIRTHMHRCSSSTICIKKQCALMCIKRI